jgi:hypothetical protein
LFGKMEDVFFKGRESDLDTKYFILSAYLLHVSFSPPG